MKRRSIFFVHQNIPAQFRYLAPALAKDGHDVYFVTSGASEIPGVTKVHYKVGSGVISPDISMFAYAQKAARAFVHVQEKRGVKPDLIIGHVGWGEMMFLRDLFPKVPMLGYFEWFHGTSSIEPQEEGRVPHPDGPFVLRTKNIPNYVSGDICTSGVTPTWWQHSTFPSYIQRKLSVIFDGTDTIKVQPSDQAVLILPCGKTLTAGDEVVTYVSRSLEPIRGFPTAMRAIAKLCRMRPKCHFVVVGREQVCYGNPLGEGDSHKNRILREINVDTNRVHFLGNVDFDTYLSVLRISSAHIYLTVPYILSWSLLEAMAAECLVFGSRTPPVEEVMVDGHNGVLVDFHDHSGLATKVADALERPDRFQPLRKKARRTILERYDLHGICLPRQKALINSLL